MARPPLTRVPITGGSWPLLNPVLLLRGCIFKKVYDAKKLNDRRLHVYWVETVFVFNVSCLFVDAVMNSSQGLSVTENEIFHRGILATTSNLIVCATILPVNESVNTFRATFIGPIVGQIWIRYAFLLL